VGIALRVIADCGFGISDFNYSTSSTFHPKPSVNCGFCVTEWSNPDMLKDEASAGADFNYSTILIHQINAL